MVHPTGQLRLPAASPLNEQLLRLIRGGDTRLVTDLSAVTSIDSSILGALISAWKDARQSGGDLRIVAPSDHVLAVLQRTNLDQVLKVYETADKAFADSE